MYTREIWQKEREDSLIEKAVVKAAKTGGLVMCPKRREERWWETRRHEGEDRRDGWEKEIRRNTDKDERWDVGEYMRVRAVPFSRHYRYIDTDSRTNRLMPSYFALWSHHLVSLTIIRVNWYELTHAFFYYFIHEFLKHVSEMPRVQPFWIIILNHLRKRNILIIPRIFIHIQLSHYCKYLFIIDKIWLIIITSSWFCNSFLILTIFFHNYKYIYIYQLS